MKIGGLPTQSIAHTRLRQSVLLSLDIGLGRGGKPTDTILDAKALKGFAGNRARKGHLVEPRLKEARLKTN
jgi:hypothetical protein